MSYTILSCYLSGASADDINVSIDVKQPFSHNGIKKL